MIFRGFSTEVRNAVQCWGLSPATIRALYVALVPLVDNCLDATTADPEGVWFFTNFDDPERPGHRYHIDLLIESGLEEIWASYIKAVRYSKDGRMEWYEDAPRQVDQPIVEKLG